MLGQPILSAKLDRVSLDNCPHSVILLGEKGCGKHLFLEQLSKKFNIDVIDITDKLSLEYIDEIYLTSLPHLYLIDGSRITEKQQNIILKFIEEPLKTSFIYILFESENVIIPTIQNRCQIWKFEPYDDEILKEFIKPEDKDNIDLLLSICRTPGQLIDNKVSNIKEMYNLVYTIIEKIYHANFANILVITDKINFKDEPEKFNYDCFLRLLKKCCVNKITEDETPIYVECFTKIEKLIKESKIRNIDKKMLFEHFLYELKMIGEQWK